MRLFALCVIVAIAVPCWSQAVVEAGVATGASAGAAAGASGAGKSIGGVLNGVTKAAARGAAPASAAAPSKTTATVLRGRRLSVPAPKPVNPAEIAAGLAAEELIARFGQPSTRTSGTRKSQSVETYWYPATTHDEVEIRLIDGKVAAVTPKGSPKPAPSVN
jgi:hypothetical protein